MYLARLMTSYEIFAIGETKEEAIDKCIKGYKTFYPANQRRFKRPTFNQLNEWYGLHVYYMAQDWCSEAD